MSNDNPIVFRRDAVENNGFIVITGFRIVSYDLCYLKNNVMWLW